MNNNNIGKYQMRRHINETIMITDDHEFMRDQLISLVKQFCPNCFIRSAACGKETKQLLEIYHRQISMLILDLKLPDVNGLELLSQIHTRYPHIRVVVMSGEESQNTVNLCLDYGALGFIPKSLPKREIITALQYIKAGGSYYPDTLTPTIPLMPVGSESPIGKLTLRQRQVLNKLCTGMSNKEIAKELKIKENTIRIHVRAIFAALNINNRTKATNIARQYGLCG